jgi:hypothetical protein
MAEPKLDAGILLTAAKQQSGLSDWGDSTFPERFSLAVSLIQGTNMGEAGERVAAANCLWLLTDRLRIFDDHKAYQLDEEVIERPLFVTGEPRSGTTLLHALLSVDPNARALRFWEVMHPSPPPGLAQPDDPRIAQADEEWREINARLPEWLKSHPYNDMLGNGLPEDERTWAFDFRVLTPTAWWRVPMGIIVAGLPADPPAQYRIHKMMLQAIQHGRPNKHWVLKGFHAGRFAAFFEAYPDAHVLYIHRDPVQVTASRIKMMVDLTRQLAGDFDFDALSRQQTAMSKASFHGLLENPMIDDPRIFHARYTDFMKDQVATIRSFYEFAGVPWSQAAESVMRHYLASNRGDRYGKFEYSTDLIVGEDIEEMREELAPYYERFSVEIERRR